MNVKHTESLESRIEKLEKAINGTPVVETIVVEREFFRQLLDLLFEWRHAGVHLMNNDVKEKVLSDTDKAYVEGVKILSHEGK